MRQLFQRLNAYAATGGAVFKIQIFDSELLGICPRARFIYERSEQRLYLDLLSFDMSPEPSAILTQVLPLMTRGHALDLACGNGRNALFLAMHGWNVTGIDASYSALQQAEAAAKSNGIKVSMKQSAKDLFPEGKPVSRIVFVEADLEKLPIPKRQFHLIVCIKYLQRSLFSAIEEALLPGGFLLYETFTRAQLLFPTGPRNPAYLLESGELRVAFPALVSIFSREMCAGKGIATLLARKPAWR